MCIMSNQLINNMLHNRYRNAFPEEYERLGYSPKQKKSYTMSYASRDSPSHDSQGVVSIVKMSCL